MIPYSKRNKETLAERAKTAKIRPKILERDNHQCSACGCRDGLEVHHVLALTNGGPSTEDNLMTLCVFCHRYAPETGWADFNDFLENRLSHIHQKRRELGLIDSFHDLINEFTFKKIDQWFEAGIINNDIKQSLIAFEEEYIREKDFNKWLATHIEFEKKTPTNK